MGEDLIKYTFSTSKKCFADASKIGLSKIERIEMKRKEFELQQEALQKTVCMEATRKLLKIKTEIQELQSDLSVLKSWSNQAAALNEKRIEAFVLVTMYSCDANPPEVSSGGFSFSSIFNGQLASFYLSWEGGDENRCKLELINGFSIHFDQRNFEIKLKQHLATKANFLSFIVNVIWPMFDNPSPF